MVVGRELEAAPRFGQIQEIRTRHGFHTKPWRDRCHVLCHAKVAWLAEQAESNPFTSDRFYWIDAGLAYPGVFPLRYLPNYLVDRCVLFTPRVLEALSPRSLVMIGMRPPAGSQMLHNIRLEDHLPFVGKGSRPIDTHVVGALFGGTREAVRGLYADYDGVLGAMLDADLLGTEENVLTILYHRDRSSVALRTFTTWYHEDSVVRRPDPSEVPFYRIFEELAGRA